MPALLALLHDDNFAVRTAGLTALGQFKESRVAEAVAARLSDGFDRHEAGDALRGLGSVAETATRRFLKDADWSLRVEVCRILGDIGTPDSLPALQQAAEKDESRIVQMSARHAADKIRRRAELTSG